MSRPTVTFQGHELRVIFADHMTPEEADAFVDEFNRKVPAHGRYYSVIDRRQQKAMSDHSKAAIKLAMQHATRENKAVFVVQIVKSATVNVQVKRAKRDAQYEQPVFTVHSVEEADAVIAEQKQAFGFA